MADNPDIDLEGFSVKELKALREKIDALIIVKVEKARDAILAEAQAKLEDIGLSLSDLAGAPNSSLQKKPADTARPVAVKYRGPDGETWTGRGRLPTWLEKAEASGRKRDEFLV